MWFVRFSQVKAPPEDFGQCLRVLHQQSWVNDESQKGLEQMWESRYDFCALRVSDQADRQKLQEKSHNQLVLLGQLENQLFGSQPWPESI